MTLVSLRYVPAFLLSAIVASAQSSPADPDARAREIGRAFQKYQEQLREIAASREAAPPWWKSASVYSSARMPEKFARAQREFHDAVRGPLGAEPVSATGPDVRYEFLPIQKQSTVAHIDQLYNERALEVRRDAPNVRLPADSEKLKQIAATRERELRAVLTPEEFEQLEMRTSPSSSVVRQRFGEVLESEAEFRTLYLLQKAFDEQYPMDEALYSSRQQEAMRRRSEAERKMMDAVNAAVGDERYALYRRAMDQDFQAFRVIVRRLGLPEATVDDAMKIRDNYAAQSMTINAESGLAYNDRRALVQDLGKEARKELAALLTPAGVDAYGTRAQWLRYLEQGMAFSTNPKDSSSTYSSVTQSVFVVLPGGVTPSSSSSVQSPRTATTPRGGEVPSSPARKAKQ
jgi:hypothetical protein